MRRTIVNEQDEIIGYKDRSEDGDITRVAGLWIFNSKGEALIAQRAFDKRYDPGKWGPAAAGTVEEGETYLSNIIKEAKEELGITLSENQLVRDSYEFKEASHKYFRQSFSTTLDLPIEKFTIQKEEVASIRWISMEELGAWVKERPDDFIVSFAKSFKNRQELMR
jgi:isopentenyl-diphosphate delta-isomerase